MATATFPDGSTPDVTTIYMDNVVMSQWNGGTVLPEGPDAPPQEASAMPSRSCARLFVIRRDTCICVTPTRSPICCWVSSSKYHNARTRRSRGDSLATIGRRLASSSTRSWPSASRAVTR